MSDPILPLAVWQSGTNENSLPANDNSLRLEALSRECLGVANSPSSSNDGDVFIVGSSPTGDFASFDEGDLAIFRAAVPGPGGTWSAWAPVSGVVVNVAGTLQQWDGASWTAVGGGGGGGVWGSITGTLSDQTDLQSALDSRIMGFADPGADSIVFWDHSAGAYAPLAIGTNLSISGTTLNASGGGAARDAVTALGTSGTLAVDVSAGDYFTTALTGNVSGITFSNLPGSGKGCSLMIRITQDSTPRTFAWPASFRWAGGTVPAISTGSGAVDVLAITTFDNGSTWDATLAKAFS